MNAQISTKFAALAAALMTNGLLIGGVAYLFSSPLHQHAAVISVARAATATATATGAASAPHGAV
jgi:hypothetical protein